jgi:hypothetical protein
MYLWALLSWDTSDPPSLRGVAGELARVMLVTEPYLIEERAFLCRIVEVRDAITVPGMDSTYVLTGRAWNGRRNMRGGVTWQETEAPAGLPVARRGNASGWDACDFGSSPSPSRAPATPRSGEWPSPRKPSDSTPSSAPTTSSQ